MLSFRPQRWKNPFPMSPYELLILSCMHESMHQFLLACMCSPIFTLSLLSSGYCANHCGYGNEIQSLPSRRPKSSLTKKQKRKPTGVIKWKSAAFTLVQGAPGVMVWGEYTPEGKGCRKDQEYGSGRAQATITSNPVREEVRKKLGTGHPEG